MAKMNFIHSVFFIFVIISFLAGMVFYARPKTPYYEYMETMNDSMPSEHPTDVPTQPPNLTNQEAGRSVPGAVIPADGRQPAMGPLPPKDGEKLPLGEPKGMDEDELNQPKGSPESPVQHIDASLENPPYNQNMLSPFDPTSQYVGIYTDIDKVHDSTKMGSPYSDNPMDANWGGVEWTRRAVDSGKYDDNLIVPYSQANGFSVQSRTNKQPLSVYA